MVDLRGKLGIAHGSHGRQPCMIVVDVESASGARLLGFVADRISEVLTLRDRDFRNGSVRLNAKVRGACGIRDLILHLAEELEELERLAVRARKGDFGPAMGPALVLGLLLRLRVEPAQLYMARVPAPHHPPNL